MAKRQNLGKYFPVLALLEFFERITPEMPIFPKEGDIKIIGGMVPSILGTELDRTGIVVRFVDGEWTPIGETKREVSSITRSEDRYKDGSEGTPIQWQEERILCWTDLSLNLSWHREKVPELNKEVEEKKEVMIQLEEIMDHLREAAIDALKEQWSAIRKYDSVSMIDQAEDLAIEFRDKGYISDEELGTWMRRFNGKPEQKPEPEPKPEPKPEPEPEKPVEQAMPSAMELAFATAKEGKPATSKKKKKKK